MAETHPDLHPVLPQCWKIWGYEAQGVGGEGLQTLPLPSGLCNPIPSTTGRARSSAPSLLQPGLSLCPPQQKLRRDAAPRTLPKQSRAWGSPACPPPPPGLLISPLLQLRPSRMGCPACPQPLPSSAPRSPGSTAWLSPGAIPQQPPRVKKKKNPPCNLPPLPHQHLGPGTGCGPQVNESLINSGPT